MPITETERDGIDNSARAKYDDLLVMMKDSAGLSLSGYAEALNWRYANGDLNKRLVQTAMTAMMKDKLIEKKNDRYCLSGKGKKAAVEATRDGTCNSSLPELVRSAKDHAAADLAQVRSKT
jgi:hypothetical protein